MTKLEEQYQALEKQLHKFELANKNDCGTTRKSPLHQSIPTGEEYRRMKEMLDRWKG
jgi:hypothetical protein